VTYQQLHFTSILKDEHINIFHMSP